MPEGVVETKRLHRALDGDDGASSRTAIPPPLSPPPSPPPLVLIAGRPTAA